MKKKFNIIILTIVLFTSGCTTSLSREAEHNKNILESSNDSQSDSTLNNQESANELIKEMIIYYGYYQTEADTIIKTDMDKLKEVDLSTYNKWSQIMNIWRNNDINASSTLSIESDLDFTKTAILILGKALNPDGSMTDELIGRLQCAYELAKDQKDIYIICSGGGTASSSPSATEADNMKKWLIENGIEEQRIIVENQSLSTGQNMINTYCILKSKFTNIQNIILATSDYHISRAMFLLQSQCILANTNEYSLHVSGHIPYSTNFKTEDYTLSEAAGLLEIIGESQIAYDIYYSQYEKPKLR